MDLLARKSASIYLNSEFMTIKTMSGYRSLISDPDGKVFLLAPNEDAQKIGSCLLEALLVSRIIKPEEIATFFNRDTLTQCYETWVTGLINQFGYSSRRALFNKMKYCSVELRDGLISIKPSHHDKLEGWGGDGIDESMIVKISESSFAEEIGKAVILAFSRCTGKGAA